ncbi:MAG: hypothetical protein ACI4IW_00035 [Oscillospiraceae bacterium]
MSFFNAMWLGLEAEALNSAEMFGAACGVSFMSETSSGKRFINRISDMSYIK